MEHTAGDGKKYSTKFYNLDAIISVGYAEMQAKRGIIMYMKDWVEKLDSFLKFNEQDILTNAGTISREVAEALALGEYEKYRIIRDRLMESDFDREVQKLLKASKKKKR